MKLYIKILNPINFFFPKIALQWGIQSATYKADVQIQGFLYFLGGNYGDLLWPAELYTKAWWLLLVKLSMAWFPLICPR